MEIAIASIASTILLAIIAIWGEPIKAKLWPPRLVLDGHNLDGDFNVSSCSTRVVYFHLKVFNMRKTAPAFKARVLCEGTSRMKADGEFQIEPLVIPVHLTWSFSKWNELLPTIGPERYVDFGYIAEGDNCFTPSLYATPGNFRGFVRKNETQRFKIVAIADNCPRSQPLYLQVSWNGRFDFDRSEMSKHLVITKVESLG